MKRFVLALTLLVLLLSVPANAGAWSSGSTLLGVYYGNQGLEMDKVRAMEAWQQKRHAVLLLYTKWDTSTLTISNLFGKQLPNVWANGNVPIISWDPFTTGVTPGDIERRVASGQFDSYIATWGAKLKTFLSGKDGVYGTSDDRRAYLRVGHEMNGDWYPWSADGVTTTAADTIAMWRRVHDKLVPGLGLDGTRLQWLWAVNASDLGPYTAEQYYPGDAYVDWVGIDGYNWGASQTWSVWQDPEAVLGPMRTRLRSLAPTKPLAVSETASTSSTTSGSDLSAKSAWITALFGWLATNDIRLYCWFNDDKETDWAVFGGSKGDTTYRFRGVTYRGYSALKTSVQSTGIIPTNTKNPRLLTDAQFQGQ